MLVALVFFLASAGTVLSSESSAAIKIPYHQAMKTCERHVSPEARKIFKLIENPADMNGYLENWCIHLGHKLHGSKSPKIQSIWRKGCALARASQALLEDPRLFSAKRYCATLIEVVSVLFAKTDKKPKRANFSRPNNLAPVAKSWHQVISHAKKSRSKKLRPCCHAHPYRGCVDTVISDCVCAKDPHCCSKSWDIKCSETVEVFSKYPDPVQGPTDMQCGRCPPEATEIIKDRFISEREL